MLAYDGIAEPGYNNTHDKRIKLLKRNGLLQVEIDNILFVIRKTRNVAVHAGMDSLEEAKKKILLTYNLASWFMQTYGDYEYEPKEFAMPEEKAVDIEQLEAKSKEQEEYIIVLGKELAELQKKGKTSAERKNKARTNAVRYSDSLSEHDTRLIIDQQLREAGWEADTDYIRQSRGSRPEKGRNKAMVVNNTFVKMLEVLGYDIELHYVKRKNDLCQQCCHKSERR